MKIPQRLKALVEEGLIDDVLGQLRSGKEADVYIVQSQGEQRCAKVFKEANKRGFRQAVQYQEGRRERNSRRARAMGKRSKFGQREQEKSWLNAEVDALYRLSHAGVTVPEPYGFVDGVLLMALITDEHGEVAPRLEDVQFSAELAREYHQRLVDEVVRMLNAGLIHGDLSEFNILLREDGPVIIDLPQAVNAAANNSAGMLLIRDVDRLRTFFGRYAPDLLETEYGKEIWALYSRGELDEHSELTGRYVPDASDIDLQNLMAIIDAARIEEEERIARLNAEDFEDY